MKRAISVFSLCLLGFSPAFASETMEFQKLNVLHSFASRGSAALMASYGHTLITLHCGGSMKSMQILNKDTGVSKAYVTDDFYCQDIANLAAHLTSGEKISVRVTTDSRPRLNEPSKSENIVLEIEIKSIENGTTNAYKYAGDGIGSRWTQLP